jgi:hypothetical protein
MRENGNGNGNALEDLDLDFDFNSSDCGYIRLLYSTPITHTYSHLRLNGTHDKPSLPPEPQNHHSKTGKTFPPPLPEFSAMWRDKEKPKLLTAKLTLDQ